MAHNLAVRVRQSVRCFRASCLFLLSSPLLSRAALCNACTDRVASRDAYHVISFDPLALSWAESVLCQVGMAKNKTRPGLAKTPVVGFVTWDCYSRTTRTLSTLMYYVFATATAARTASDAAAGTANALHSPQAPSLLWSQSVSPSSQCPFSWGCVPC